MTPEALLTAQSKGLGEFQREAAFGAGMLGTTLNPVIINAPVATDVLIFDWEDYCKKLGKGSLMFNLVISNLGIGMVKLTKDITMESVDSPFHRSLAGGNVLDDGLGSVTNYRAMRGKIYARCDTQALRLCVEIEAGYQP